MNKLYMIILCFIILVSCSNKINWENDFDKAIEKSKSENKPIMMDIYTDWCGACKEMDKTTFKNKEVSDYTTNFITLKFNPEKSSNGDNFLKKYNIPGFPTMLFMNSDGFVIKRIIGYIESDKLINEMRGIKQKEENIKNAFKDETPSIEKLDIYIDSGYAKEASDMYDILIKENKIPEDNITKYMSKIAVMLLDNDDYEILFKLSDTGQLWKERMSIVANWIIVKNGKFEILLTLSRKFLSHKHDLMHKAVGWILREMGKSSTDGYKALLNFLDENANVMPRTMLRYSLEKLPIELKNKYMRK